MPRPVRYQARKTKGESVSKTRGKSGRDIPLPMERLSRFLSHCGRDIAGPPHPRWWAKRKPRRHVHDKKARSSQYPGRPAGRSSKIAQAGTCSMGGSATRAAAQPHSGASLSGGRRACRRRRESLQPSVCASVRRRRNSSSICIVSSRSRPNSSHRKRSKAASASPAAAAS
jgi:hypothetical protein